MPDFVTLAITAGAVLLLLIIVSVVWKFMYQIPAPNEALLVSGFRAKTENAPFIVSRSARRVYPWIQKGRKINVDSRRTNMSVTCPTSQGIMVEVQGVVMFKIGDTEEMITRAAICFLDKPDDESMEQEVKDLFAGFLRAVIGRMEVENVISGRDELRNEVRESIESALEPFGLVVIGLQIQEILTPSGYIKNMGRAQEAKALTVAEIAEADRQREAAEKKAQAAALIAAAERDSAVKQAGFKAETDKAQAEAAQAGPLAQALARQKVVETETETAKLEALRREQQLQSEVIKPADAEAYARIKDAEASKTSNILEAEAAAEKTRLEGAAMADSTRLNGEAEASAIGAKLNAEAAGLKARAEALAENQEAVLAQQVTERLPEVVAALAGPLGNVHNMTVTTNDFAGLAAQFLGQVGPLVQIARQMLVNGESSNGHTPAVVSDTQPEERVLVPGDRPL